MREVGKALVRAMRATAIVVGIAGVMSGAIVWGIGGGDAAWAALAGIGVAAFVGLSTQAAMLLGSRFSFTVLSGILLGSFVVKAIVLVVVFLAVRDSDLSTGAFAWPLVIGVVATLVVDTVVLVRARIPYVEPGGIEEQG